MLASTLLIYGAKYLRISQVIFDSDFRFPLRDLNTTPLVYSGYGIGFIGRVLIKCFQGRVLFGDVGCM